MRTSTQRRRGAARSRFQNTGQSCIAAKRIIVEEPVADAFTEKLLEQVGALRLGNPTDDDVTVGPLARGGPPRRSRSPGRPVRRSGRPDPRRRSASRPARASSTSRRSSITSGRACPCSRRRCSAPPCPSLRAADAEEALALANATPYGLGSAVWTSDLDRGEAFASRLDAGHTAVNGMTVSDPRLPFGGVKDSGYGRELSHHGLLEFVNIHTVVVNAPDGPREDRRTASE